MGRLRKDTLCDIFGVSASKHRSCWLHIVAHHYRNKNHITWEDVKEIKKKYRHTAPCFSRTLPRRVRILEEHSTSSSSNGTDNQTVISPMEGDKPDTYRFDFYMERLWKNLAEDKIMSFAYLDSSWFSLCRERPSRPKVLTRIKRKCIFSKKYVFVPIFCRDRWSLLILVHLGERPDSESRTPCMLLLDSLQGEDPERFEPEIRKFVVDLYKSEGRIEDMKGISQIQQANLIEIHSIFTYIKNRRHEMTICYGRDEEHDATNATSQFSCSESPGCRFSSNAKGCSS